MAKTTPPKPKSAPKPKPKPGKTTAGTSNVMFTKIGGTK
jgi:hypothetical protein